MNEKIKFKEAVMGFRNGDPNINSWWVEKINAIATGIIQPFISLGLEEEELRQDTYVLIYEKLATIDPNDSFTILRSSALSRLTGIIGMRYGITVTGLRDEIISKKYGKCVEKLKRLIDVAHINNLSNNLNYIDAFPISLLHGEIHELLDTLTNSEAKVLRMRFGIGCYCPHSIEETGKEFRVTGQRIRQIEAKALRKLRHPSRSSRLRGYFYEEELLSRYEER